MLFRSLHFTGGSQRSDQKLFRVGDLSFDRGLYAGHRPVSGSMLQLLPQNGGVDAEFLRDLVRQFVAYDSARNSLDVWQQVIQRLHLALGAANGELALSALDQVIKITLWLFEWLA